MNVWGDGERAVHLRVGRRVRPDSPHIRSGICKLDAVRVHTDLHSFDGDFQVVSAFDDGPAAAWPVRLFG